MKAFGGRLAGAVCLLGVALFSSVIPQTALRTAARTPQAPPLRVARHGAPYTIALSNSYIGNTWRVEMENEFKAACGMQPYKSQVKCSVYNSGNSISAQTQEMDNLISSRVDAIVIDAASPTGLNGVIAQACRAGILVISYDNVVTAPCALKVNTDQFQFGKQLAAYLVNAMHDKGNVIMVTGVAGTHVDEQRNAGALSVFNAHPGIKVVAKYAGLWDSSVAQRATASQLGSLGRIDGVWCQGGTDGVIRALLAAHRTFPIPVAGEAENGFRQYMLQYKSRGFKAMSIGQPPFLVLVSLELARAVLQGKHAKADITIPFPYVTTATVKEGVTTFKSQSSSFFDDFTDSGANATVRICVAAAAHAQPCAGSLNIRLPK